VLSNLLLVLGMSFFCGGIVSTVKAKKGAASTQGRQTAATSSDKSSQCLDDKPAVREESYTEFVGEKVQTFSVMSALVNTSMLLLSCLSFSLVTVFYSITKVDGVPVMESVLLPVSRICSVIIAFAYLAYIIFQLVTHKEAMAEDEGGEDDEDEQPRLTVVQSIVVLFFTTVVVAVCSDMLVGALEGVSEKAHIGKHFIGIILLPIVGNACEHAAAIRFAMQDKPGLSIGIAVGSSTQISLFVVPFSVLIGWAIGQPMDLNFGSLNTTVMTLSVVVVLSVVVDGTANWLQGYLLVSAYAVVAVLYWFLPNELPHEH